MGGGAVALPAVELALILELLAALAGHEGVGFFIARTDHHTELLDSRAGGFAQNDFQGGSGNAITVDEDLKRKRPLVRIGGGDEGLADVYDGIT